MSLVGMISAAVLAQGCAALPAPSAKYVPVSVVTVDADTRRTALRVCVGGRRVELARGTLHEDHGGVRVGAASAAGHRVAWIEERVRGRTRSAVVTLAAVGREVRVLRRFTAHRERTRYALHTDVLLTRQGDLAWTAGTSSVAAGVVAVKQPGRPTRKLARHEGGTLALEAGRTLRWDDGDVYGFHDLRPVDCRHRPGYRRLGVSEQAIVTRRVYGSRIEGITVLRGCDPDTGRDRGLLQTYSSLSYITELQLVGLDHQWAVFTESITAKEPEHPEILVWNALTGRRISATFYDREDRLLALPPRAGGSFAVTSKGSLAWVGEAALHALVANHRIIQLDTGAIADLRADGDAFTWTRDGVPRRFEVGG